MKIVVFYKKDELAKNWSFAEFTIRKSIVHYFFDIPLNLLSASRYGSYNSNLFLVVTNFLKFLNCFLFAIFFCYFSIENSLKINIFCSLKSTRTYQHFSKLFDLDLLEKRLKFQAVFITNCSIPHSTRRVLEN